MTGVTYFGEAKDDAKLTQLTEKILRSESPGMRNAELVDAFHVVEDNDIVSFVVYDKSPTMVDSALQYERRWVVVVSLQDSEGDSPSVSKTRGIVSLSWDEPNA